MFFRIHRYCRLPNLTYKLKAKIHNAMNSSSPCKKVIYQLKNRTKQTKINRLTNQKEQDVTEKLTTEMARCRRGQRVQVKSLKYAQLLLSADNMESGGLETTLQENMSRIGNYKTKVVRQNRVAYSREHVIAHLYELVDKNL